MGEQRDTIDYLNSAVLTAEDESRRLRRSVDLLCAAIADESLNRVALQTVARMLTQPQPKPTPEIMEWAKKIVANR